MSPRVACLIAPLALLLACSQPPMSPPDAADQRPAQPGPQTVVVIGSSTAAGVGASSAATSWVGRLADYARARCPQTTIQNLAVGGYTTWQGMPAAAPRPQGRPASQPARNVEAALALQPALVLILFPSNDAALKFPLAETLANHAALRDAVRAAGAAEMIVGPFPRAFTDTAQIALMTGLRDQLPAIGAPRYIALWDALAARDNAVRPEHAAGDGIHLNDSGHAVIAERVRESAAFAAVCPPSSL